MGGERLRAEATVRGTVQGVFYRDSTRREALGLGLTGYVQNLTDGTVRIVAEGSAGQLERLRRWSAAGPPAARVTELSWRLQEATGEFDAFEIRPTAAAGADRYAPGKGRAAE